MQQYKAWPFQESQQIATRRSLQGDRPVLFQTGFGPSGLPHIGTFAEVARTNWVRRACEHLRGTPARLLAFSDDMDGLRKVPLNMPGADMLSAHLGKPLCNIPDPFGCCDSFSGHMNGKLQEFLDTHGFDYEFQSSREAYCRGDFDEGLSILLERVCEVRDLILPTLREENREQWSPFFPICPSCGSVNATRVTGYHPQSNTVDFTCDLEAKGAVSCGHSGEVSVLGGAVKVGWKADWALRWFSYDVDYEMYGKDLTDSVKLSGRIVRLMGKAPPTGLRFELFLDEEGRKISKSVGKGLTVDTWVDYAPVESLLYYIYQNPKRAKRLHWGVVPQCVDDYLEALRLVDDIGEADRPNESLWHIFGGRSVPRYQAKVNFSVVNNLISALGTDSADLLMDYLGRYDDQVFDYPQVIQSLIEKGLSYYRDKVLPTKTFRHPSGDERVLLGQLRQRLALCGNVDEDALQAIPFDVAKESGVEPRDLFRTVYEILLGQERGPRFGSFVKLVGKERVLEMLDDLGPGARQVPVL